MTRTFEQLPPQLILGQDVDWWVTRALETQEDGAQFLRSYMVPIEVRKGDAFYPRPINKRERVGRPNMPLGEP